MPTIALTETQRLKLLCVLRTRLDYALASQFLEEIGLRTNADELHAQVVHMAESRNMDVNQLLLTFTMHDLPADMRATFLRNIHRRMEMLTGFYLETHRKGDSGNFYEAPAIEVLGVLVERYNAEESLANIAGHFNVPPQWLPAICVSIAGRMKLSGVTPQWLSFMYSVWRYSTPYAPVTRDLLGMPKMIVRRLHALLHSHLDYIAASAYLASIGDYIESESLSDCVTRYASKIGVTVPRLMVQYIMHVLPLAERTVWLTRAHCAVQLALRMHDTVLSPRTKPVTVGNVLAALVSQNYERASVRLISERLSVGTPTVVRLCKRMAEIMHEPSSSLRWLHLLYILAMYSTPHVEFE